MRFPMNTYQGEESSWGEKFQLNIITSLIWDYFFVFSNAVDDFPSGIFSDFFRAALFSQKLLLHISLTTSTQQLLFRSIYFFRAVVFLKELRFQKNHFLAGVIFSEYLIFRNQTSNEQLFCENRKFFRAVTFRSNYFFREAIAQNKDICTRAPLIEAGTSTQHQLFRKSYIFEKPTFPESYLFERPDSKDVDFYSSNLFRTATFSQHTFSEELLFHSYASSPAALTFYQLTIK